MCESCEMRGLCKTIIKTKVGDSHVSVGVVKNLNTRIAICVGEYGIEPQRIFIARSGLALLLAVLSAAAALFQ